MADVKRLKAKVGELKQRVWDLNKELRMRDNQIHAQRVEEIRLNVHNLHLTERLHERDPEVLAQDIRRSLSHLGPEERQKMFEWMTGIDKQPGTEAKSSARTKKESAT